MTQAFNLSQLANNLNTSGQLDATDGLVNAVPVANGGTGASTEAAARTNLNVPTRTGNDASGTWGINITGNAATATSATSATSATNATNAVNLTGTSTANISSAALATGTASGSNFLRGDRSWQTVAVPSTDFDGVGSYVVAFYAANSTAATTNNFSYLERGTTVAGSSLRVNNRTTSDNINPGANAGINNPSFSFVSNPTSNVFPTANSTVLSGTWRLMNGGAWTQNTADGSYAWFPMLWVRIS